MNLLSNDTVQYMSVKSREINRMINPRRLLYCWKLEKIVSRCTTVPIIHNEMIIRLKRLDGER